MQQSIAELSEEVSSVSSNPMDQLHSRLPMSVQNTGLARPEVRMQVEKIISIVYDGLCIIRGTVKFYYRKLLHNTFMYESVSDCYIMKFHQTKIICCIKLAYLFYNFLTMQAKAGK
jgi:hypothetical protein